MFPGFVKHSNKRKDTLPVEVKVPGAVRPDISSGKPVILVVTDNCDDRIALKVGMQGKCTVLEASDGQVGYELAMIVRPDLVLVDISLPKLGGIRVINAIRQVERVHQTPVIAMASAPAIQNHRESILSYGFDDIISKPVDLKQLETLQMKINGNKLN